MLQTRFNRQNRCTDFHRYRTKLTDCMLELLCRASLLAHIPHTPAFPMLHSSVSSCPCTSHDVLFVELLPSPGGESDVETYFGIARPPGSCIATIVILLTNRRSSLLCRNHFLQPARRCLRQRLPPPPVAGLLIVIARRPFLTQLGGLVLKM